jgi:hypothetical protein
MSEGDSAALVTVFHNSVSAATQVIFSHLLLMFKLYQRANVESCQEWRKLFKGESANP